MFVVDKTDLNFTKYMRSQRGDRMEKTCRRNSMLGYQTFKETACLEPKHLMQGYNRVFQRTFLRLIDLFIYENS